MKWYWWTLIAVAIIAILVWGYNSNWWGMSKTTTVAPTTPASSTPTVAVTTNPTTGQKTAVLRVA